jgi:hypothetical protein
MDIKLFVSTSGAIACSAADTVSMRLLEKFLSHMDPALSQLHTTGVSIELLAACMEV